MDCLWRSLEGTLIAVEEGVGVRKGALECIQQQPAIKVKELMRWKEALSHKAGNQIISGLEYEENNIYKIYPMGGWDDIFYAEEKTGFLSRNLSQIPYVDNCMPWKVEVAYCEGLGKEDFIKIERPGTCPCCCFCRPTANVIDANGETLGKLVDPLQCGLLCKGYFFEIKDPDNKTVLKVRGGERVDPGKPAKLAFTIHGVEDDSVLATLHKQFGKNILHDDDVDTYFIQFVGDCSADQRVLMMALSMFIDLQHFNGGIEICKKKRRPPKQQQMEGSLQEPLNTA